MSKTCSFTVAIIRENKYRLSQSDMNDTTLSYDNLESVFEDFVEFRHVTDIEDMMVLVGDVLGMRDGVIGDTSTCYETEDCIYQLCHLSSLVDTRKNYVGTTLVRETSSVVGAAVLMKIKVDSNKTCTNVDISMKDTIDLYRKVHKHIGLSIDANGTVDELQYFFNPIDRLKPNEMQNMKYFEFLLFENCVVQMFIEQVPSSEKMNDRASIIASAPVCGKVVLGMRIRGEHVLDSETKYIDFTKDTLEKLTCVRSVSYDEFNIPKPDAKAIPTEEQLQQKAQSKVFKNFFTVLNQAYSLYVKKYGTSFQKDQLKDMAKEKSLNTIISVPSSVKH
jgi:hypothetical protein